MKKSAIINSYFNNMRIKSMPDSEQTKSTSDTEETNCPFCGQKVNRDHLNFEINKNEQTVCILNLFDMVKHIEKQNEIIEELKALVKELSFKN